MERNIQNAAERQSLQDILLGSCNMNLGKKNVYSAAASGVYPSISTTGDYAINGQLYSKTAASSALSIVVVKSAATSSAVTVSIPAYGAMVAVLALDASGNGYIIPSSAAVLDKMGNAYGSGAGFVMTSAQVSSAVANPNLSAATVPATILADLEDIVTHRPPDAQCAIGTMTIVAGSVSHLLGTSTFSTLTSAGGSCVFTDNMNLNMISSPASQPYTG